MSIAMQPLLTDGRWVQSSQSLGSFHAHAPATGEACTDQQFPISGWKDLEALLTAGQKAAAAMAELAPQRIAEFLEHYATALEARGSELVALAHRETGLPIEPRLASVELPRTTNQLRLAARAARDPSWRKATLDTALNIRSLHAPLGNPVLVLGPNNFPFAFNGIAGGDFAAAIAAGNPVIAKAHPAHPGTSMLLAAAALEAAIRAQLPSGAVQMFYHTEPELGLRLVEHAGIAAVAFTGSRAVGMTLKSAADRVGKPIYLEMSSVNPVFILGGALRERGAAIASELHASCTLGAGQFCTKPGLAVLAPDAGNDTFVESLRRHFANSAAGVLLTPGSVRQMSDAVAKLRAAGAELLAGGSADGSQAGFRFQPTLLRVSGTRFLENATDLQHEAFGPLGLVVTADSDAQLLRIAQALEGNLTASIYSDTAGSDDVTCDALSAQLRRRVGRLLNDKMPTGVAVSAAMNHGGPFPATGHPGFTAVGLPASMLRFTALHCYDNVREQRLPPLLRQHNADAAQRLIDGVWTTRDV